MRDATLTLDALQIMLSLQLPPPLMAMELPVSMPSPVIITSTAAEHKAADVQTRPEHQPRTPAQGVNKEADVRASRKISEANSQQEASPATCHMSALSSACKRLASCLLEVCQKWSAARPSWLRRRPLPTYLWLTAQALGLELQNMLW
jgi:hypothetical protein